MSPDFIIFAIFGNSRYRENRKLHEVAHSELQFVKAVNGEVFSFCKQVSFPLVQ